MIEGRFLTLEDRGTTNAVISKQIAEEFGRGVGQTLQVQGHDLRIVGIYHCGSLLLDVAIIGAATGGVFFGWLGDRIGRVRAMALSILTYALFTGLCGLAGEAWHIAVLRFIASLGMGGEWALGVALVTELWPDRSRAFLAGLIGAAANVGMLLVGLLSLVLVSFIQGFGELLLNVGHEPVRHGAVDNAVIVFIVCDRGDRYLSTGVFPA